MQLDLHEPPGHPALMDNPTTLLNQFTSLFQHNPDHPPGTDACYWQTDIHSHLLPNVDDGVSTPEQTLTCLRQLSAWGIRHVITTPHVSQDWYPNDRATLLAGQAMLQALVAEHQIPLTIEVAAEYLADDLFLELLRTDQILSFGQKRYVLFEIGWISPPFFLDEVLSRLLAQGYQPLLAHPERYLYYHDNLKPLADLHAANCLFQINWGSLTGRYGSRVKRQGHRLLKNKWIDFIGSDIHRPPDLSSLDKLFTSSSYELLKQQPLRNQELTGPSGNP